MCRACIGLLERASDGCVLNDRESFVLIIVNFLFPVSFAMVLFCVVMFMSRL
jgi:hypothetical protein